MPEHLKRKLKKTDRNKSMFNFKLSLALKLAYVCTLCHFWYSRRSHCQ
jgi:hypothetical protein